MALSLMPNCRLSPPAPLYNIEKSVQAPTAMVVSPHPLATDIGNAVLKAGGNATDAMVAVQFALAVVYPRAGNVGGGGFMVFRNNDGSTASVDYREKAPAMASRDMYLDAEGKVDPVKSRAGHLAAGVPGAVDGLLQAWEKYGQLKDRSAILNPAIKLASEGFAITATEANRLNGFAEAFAKYNDAGHTAFMKDTDWQEGDLLIQKELAHTLELIRDQGRNGFYTGETADKIVAEMQQGGGLISLEDLKNYSAKWRAPVTGQYKDYTIISMPPPSSGGIALVQLLKIVENYPLQQWGFHSTKSVHLMTEAERRVYADRAEHLGDSDFYPVPQDSMLQADYLQERMEDYDASLATASDEVLAGNFNMAKESFETTHTSIIDGAGNAVSCTTTLNSNYGCKVVVDGAGLALKSSISLLRKKPA
ncbi:MAG: gamma-glutamyltransferase, partial [Bacteroidota bacterium]